MRVNVLGMWWLLFASCMLSAWPPPPEPVVEITAVTVTPDGKHLLLGLSDGTPEGVKGHKALIRMIDLESGKEVKNFRGYKGVVWSLAVTPDGKHLLSYGADGGGASARLWSLKTAKEVRQFPEKASVTVVAISPDGKTLLTCGGQRRAKLTLWDVETGKKGKVLDGPDCGIEGVAFSPDNSKLLLRTGGTDGSYLKIMNAQTGEVTKSFDGRKERWTPPAVFSPDSGILLLQKEDSFYKKKPAYSDHHLVLWDLKAGKEHARQLLAKENHPKKGGHGGFVARWLFFRKDGKRALVIDDVGGMALLDLKTRKKAWTKKFTLSQWFDHVFHVADDRALVVTLEVGRGPQATHPTRYGATLICTWYDLDDGKQLKTKEVTLKW
jgi:WD40 repeat protein